MFQTMICSLTLPFSSSLWVNGELEAQKEKVLSQIEIRTIYIYNLQVLQFKCNT